MGSYRSRLRSVCELAIAQLWYYRRRTLLAIVGVALSVLVISLLVGMGNGVSTKGAAGIANLNRDLWMSAPVDIVPAAVGGVENGLLDAHEVAHSVESRPDVRIAQAVGFQTVYVGRNGSNVDTLAGVGITGTSAPIPVTSGVGFSAADRHYANGSYDGPMTGEVIVGERVADSMNVTVGDTLYVGGTVASARANAFEVVGITPAISTFVGVPTVVLPLGELQALTGTTGTDPATYVTITLTPDADPGSVAHDLERAFPGYEVRTNSEQFETIVAGHGTVITSAVAIAAVAVLMGIALVVTVLWLVVYHQRPDLAALLASGVSPGTLVAVVFAQGAGIGAAGGFVGLAAAFPVTVALNRTMAALTGFENLVLLRPWILLLACGVGVGMGFLGALTAGWRIVQIDPVDHLR